MIRTTLGALLICLPYSMAHAQAVKSAKGYLCKNIGESAVYSIYNPYDHIGLRTGNRVESYRLVVYGIPMELTRYSNHAWLHKDRIGTEYLVKYKVVDGEKQATSISKTGRIKNVKPCTGE
jgi:hypothetical protein